jgi:hypothetical protein
MRFLVLSSLVTVGVMVGGVGRGDEQGATGLELGLRVGYAVPLGAIAGSAPPSTATESLSDVFSGQIPIWIDAGYRIPNVYVGAFFQYGLLILANNTTTRCGQPGVTDCSGNDLVFGANAHYHFVPAGSYDPWMGVGFGFEWANLSQTVGKVSGTSQFNGWQFVDLQAGVDVKVSGNFGIGPFVALSLGQYSSASASMGSLSFSGDIKNQELHEWLTVGIRGAYDVDFGRRTTTDVQGSSASP